MTAIVAPAREVPVLSETDVIVAGGGVGGVCAAVAAARAGTRVLLVERHSYPGGVATAGLMCSITNYLVTRDGRRVTAGLPAELIDRLIGAGGALPDYLRAGQPQIPLDPETLKRVMVAMLREAGVECLYAATVSQTIVVAEAAVEALICETPSGPVAVKGRQFVDATGDLSVLTGAGGPAEEVHGSATLLFRMANVDVDAIVDWLQDHPEDYSPRSDVPTSLEDTIANWRRYGVFHLPHYAGREISVVRDATESGDLPATYGLYARDLWAMGMYGNRALPGVVLVNSCAFDGVAFDPVRRSRCEEEGRAVAAVLAEFLRSHFPGFSTAHLLDTAAELGVRLSRRLLGRHVLTGEEYRGGLRFADTVGRTTEVDRSGPAPTRYARGGEIPLRCLLADWPSNVICGSGKSACTDPAGLLRGQVGCMVIGEAAGAAAALAAARSVALNELDPDVLRRHLRAAGVDLGD